MTKLKERIEAHTLANAIKYDGKANPNNVLPKIIAEFPETKQDIAKLKEQIEETVATINNFSLEEQKQRIAILAPELLEKKQVKEKNLPPLPNAVDGSVVTRIPPEPSKYNHLGHAMSFLINAIYAERYHGRTVLRFEDTNPEKVNEEFVESMLYDIQEYLGIKPGAIRFVADDMEQLYAYAEHLITAGGAYMCFCDRERMQQYRQECIACACRDNTTAHHIAEWQKFKDGKYMNGECILRFKGDMQSQNTVLRDPVLYRAVKTPHYRLGDKYKVWPMYDFYNPIEDSLCEITHILRSNEFELRVPLHQQIKKFLGLSDQHVLQYGRINITGATTQGREIRALIETGEYIGWDDPRLVTLKALKRRGIKKEAYYELVKTLGLSPYQINLDFTMLAAANRKFIENANRYSFIHDPVQITISGVSEEKREVILNLHPERKGGRPLTTTNKILVSPEDNAQFMQKRVRLMGNLTFEEKNNEHLFLHYEQTKGGYDMIINWLPAEHDQIVSVEIMMPDATIQKGYAEKNIASVNVDDIIQFERFGFCRLDAIEKTNDNIVYKFWYTHK